MQKRPFTKKVMVTTPGASTEKATQKRVEPAADTSVRSPRPPRAPRSRSADQGVAADVAKPRANKPKPNKVDVKSTEVIEKPGLHPRNKYTGRYDFKALIECSPGLARFVSVNAYQTESIDFANPEAVRALNRALLQLDYGITGWNLPPQFLCPPIPGRADYIHHIADLLSYGNNDEVPRGTRVRVLDIGVGANCIYPLIGHSEYGWRFVGSDIDASTLKYGQSSINSNEGYADAIELRLQNIRTSIFEGVIYPDEVFDISMCNPPFHASIEEANASTARKLSSLAKVSAKKSNKPSQKGRPKPAETLALNFGGQYAELCCKGGEEGFISRMIAESALMRNNCFWFTTLVSKASSLPALKQALKQVGVAHSRTIDMAQGQKISRILAWTFLTPRQHASWRERQGMLVGS